MPAPCETSACNIRSARNFAVARDAETLSISLKERRYISRASVELGDFCFDRNSFLK